FSGSRVEGGEQVQCTATAVFVLDQGRSILLRGTSRRPPWARLQTGHLVGAQDDLIGPQRLSVQVADLLDLCGERRVAWHLGRKPHLLPPWLETMVQQDLTNRLCRD